MPQVVFLSPDSSDPVTAVAFAGGALVDLCDAVEAPVPFSCRSATCGTCRVLVLEGASLLSPPDADEESLLALFAGSSLVPAGATERLACQAKVHAGPGCVTLRAVADDVA